jgi:Spy/CpxP family protein refolding chaperone
MRVGLFLVGVMVLASAGGLVGQDKKEKKDEPKDTTKFKGQLPQYWGQLGLTDEQKQKVYKLQGKANEQIEKLQQQINELKEKAKKDRMEILTAEQKKRLEAIIKEKAGTDKN